MTNGSGLGLDPLELRHSRLILIWGSNTRLTNRHLWPTIEAARADGARVVVIDPIRTLTAEAADELVQPRPGTDIALMLAMMHVLVRDDLVDQAWIDEHTVGFDELVAHVADWTPAGRPTCAASTPTSSSGWPASTARSGRRPSARSSAPSTTRTGRCSTARSPCCRPSSGRGRTVAAAWRAASGRTTTPSSTTPRSAESTCSRTASRAAST